MKNNVFATWRLIYKAMKIRFVASWHLGYIGVRWDRHWKRLYVMLLPFLGFVFDFAPIARMVHASKFPMHQRHRRLLDHRDEMESALVTHESNFYPGQAPPNDWAQGYTEGLRVARRIMLDEPGNKGHSDT